MFQLYESLEDIQAATLATKHRAVALRLAIQETGHDTNQYNYLVTVAARACQIERELKRGDRDGDGYLLNAGEPQDTTYVYNQSAACKAIAMQQALKEVGVDADPWSIAGRAVNIESSLTRTNEREDGLAEFLPCVTDTTFAHQRQETNQEEDYHSCMTMDDDEVTYKHPKPLLTTMKVMLWSLV